MAQKFITPITIKQLASAGSDALTVFLDGEVYGRVKLEAGGRISWSDGTGTYDTNLYRDGANTLATDDVLKAVAGIVTLAVNGTPTASLPNGALAVDTTNNIFYFRSNNAWNQVSGGAGGASVTVSDSAPASPSSGDLWFDSTLGVMFIYYDSVWVDVGGGGVVNFVLDTVTAKGDLIVGTADGAADNLAAGANGTYLKANSSTATGLEWASIPAIDASAIISAAGGDGTNGQALTTNGSGTLDFTTIVGTTEASIISAVGADGAAGSVLKTNGSGDLSFGDVALGTNTTGNYVASLVAGTGVTLTNGTASEGGTPTVAIGQAVGTASNVQFNDVTVDGNLTVNGTTTTLNTETLAIEDNIVVLNSNVTGSPTTNAGIEVERGTSANVLLRWNETTDKWEFTNDGSVYTALGGSVAISDTAPSSPVQGAVWFESDTLKTFVYYDSSWVEIGVTAAAAVLDDLTNVTASTPSSGDFLKWNGTAWVNDPINLGTDTTGNYVSDVTASTGITVTHTPGEGSSATVALNATLDDLSNVSVASPSSGQFLKWNGTAWVNDAVPIISNIDDITGVTITAAADKDFLMYNGTAWVDQPITLGTDTTGSYVTSLVAGTGVTLTNNSGEGATPTIAIGQAVGTGSNVTFNDLTVSGNLTVSGTTTSINTETLTVDDNIIVLNNNVTSTPTENAGIEIERGTSANVLIRWNETTDKWEFTNDGSAYSNLGAGGATISDTAPASPTAGQIWFQSTNGKTFVYYDSQWIEVGGVGTGARMVSSSSAPASPLEGSMWFDTDTAQTFVYYDSSWIEIGASGVTASVQDSAPASPVSGQIWFNSLTGGTYVYYGTNWIEVGASPFSALVNTINTKGDLLVGTADNTIGGLGVGSANQVLTVDSSTATGLKWATPVSTGKAIAMSIVFGS